MRAKIIIQAPSFGTKVAKFAKEKIKTSSLCALSVFACRTNSRFKIQHFPKGCLWHKIQNSTFKTKSSHSPHPNSPHSTMHQYNLCVCSDILNSRHAPIHQFPLMVFLVLLHTPLTDYLDLPLR